MHSDQTLHCSAISHRKLHETILIQYRFVCVHITQMWVLQEHRSHYSSTGNNTTSEYWEAPLPLYRMTCHMEIVIGVRYFNRKYTSKVSLEKLQFV